MFKYQISFLKLFIEYGQEKQTLSEIELPITSGITHNSKQSELDKNLNWLDSRK